MDVAAAGDPRRDPARSELSAVAVVVVTAIGEQLPRSSAGAAAPAPNRRDGIDQRDQLGNVVAVAAGQAHRKRDTAGIADQVVLGARTAAVDR